MKNKVLTAAALLSAASFTACNDMLDTDPRVTEMTSATFPGKPADVEALNAATYAILNTMGGGDADTQHPFYWWEIMSDNCVGAGGLQDTKVKALDNLVTMNSDQFEMPFTILYGGVSRANTQIETIDNVPWTADEMGQRNQLLGEGYFMRGLYTLWLTQLYGDIPLINSTVITEEMKNQVSAEDVIYPQILSDMVSGINLMSGDKKSGHANKYVAESFAARAYMFWAGFYKKVADLSQGDATINLVAQEGCEIASLSKADIVKFLEDIDANGGYTLCEDYRSLWQYSNSLVWDEAHDGKGHAYDFIADMKREHCFDMPGMGNGNTEELFQIQFMNASSWNINGADAVYSTARMYCNYLSVFWALRVNGKNGDRDYTYPFTQGWGQGSPAGNIWDDWTIAENNGGVNPYTDKRKRASIIDGFSENKEINYDFVKDDCEDSGLGVKKYNGVTLDALTGDSPWWDKAPGYSASSLDNPMQGDHFEDFYLMRLSDVYLMLAELKGDVTYMNKVQQRAGIPAVNQTKTYTLAALQDERRWEFAFEGIRFNDLRRWSGKGGGTGCLAAKALQAQEGKQVVVAGDKANKISLKHCTTSWAERYAATDGFLAKPQKQIDNMPGKLIQNPGWDTPDAVFVDIYN